MGLSFTKLSSDLQGHDSACVPTLYIKHVCIINNNFKCNSQTQNFIVFQETVCKERPSTTGDHTSHSSVPLSSIICYSFLGYKPWSFSVLCNSVAPHLCLKLLYPTHFPSFWQCINYDSITWLDWGGEGSEATSLSLSVGFCNVLTVPILISLNIPVRVQPYSYWHSCPWERNFSFFMLWKPTQPTQALWPLLNSTLNKRLEAQCGTSHAFLQIPGVDSHWLSLVQNRWSQVSFVTLTNWARHGEGQLSLNCGVELWYFYLLWGETCILQETALFFFY